MFLARLRLAPAVALVALLPSAYARAQTPAPPSVRYDIEDLGTLSGEWAQAEGVGTDGSIVGQAQAIRRTPPTLVGSPARRRALSYFDRDSGYSDRQMIDVLTLAYLLANPRQIGNFYSNKRRSAEDRLDERRGVTLTPPRPVGTPIVQVNGHLRELPTPDDRGGIALGSAPGIAVGAIRFSPVSDTLHAVAWVGTDRPHCVDLEGDHARGNSIAEAVSADGVIVGSADTGEGITRAFRWSDITPDDKGTLAPRVRQELGTLGGPRSAARSISGNQIVGWSEVAPKEVRAFAWDGYRMQALETPAPLPTGTQTDARTVSGSRYIAGVAYLADGTRRALLWTDRRGQVLASLPDTDSAEANAVNTQGIAVGAAYHAGTATPAAGSISDDRFLPPGVAAPPASSWAVVWNQGSIRDLNTLIAPTSGWILRQATGITDRGEIVGWGLFHGQVRAFRLRPRP